MADERPRKPVDTWDRYARLVLEQIDINSTAIKEAGVSLHQLRNDVNTKFASLQVKIITDLARLERVLDEARRAEIAAAIEQVKEEIDKVREDVDKKIGAMGAEIKSLNTSVTTLNLKAGIWATVGSILGVVAVYLVAQLSKLVGGP
jgi:hypothetical protein